MIEGVIRHCTEMAVDRQYVDSHGQSEVAFAFCRLLGFQLLPRLKNIRRQRLYRPVAGEPDVYPHLWHVLTRPIDWELIRQQYDEMVKYATALRLGTAETEAILRRFTRNNIQHPTYKALAEFGKAIKTIFLCRYLHDEGLRREINDGLHVIEHWNSANDFVFFARRGELGSNRHEDQELSMLSLHLLRPPHSSRPAGHHASDLGPREPLRPLCDTTVGNGPCRKFFPGMSVRSSGI
jgi:TnpA family transposase